MRKILFSVIATLTLAAPAQAGPAIDFTILGSLKTCNAAQHDTATDGGIQTNGFVYTGGTTYVTNKGPHWLQSNSDDLGLRYCSKNESCGPTNMKGNGDANGISNEERAAIIRLTRTDRMTWSDLWVSSLDSGGSNSNEKASGEKGGNETGTIYWSNDPIANLKRISTFTTFSLSSSGFGYSGEGSIFGRLSRFDVNAKYLFIRAGSYGANGHSLNGTNSDFLVWSANLAAVREVNVPGIPESEIYAMMLAGLGMIGFVACRRKRTESTAA